MPPDYRFCLGSQVGDIELVKVGDFEALLWRPQWGDQQRPPPESYDDTQEVFLLSPITFERLRAEVGRLDIDGYAALGDRDFIPSPPDAGWLVFLTLEERGKTLLDLRRPYVGLADKWQAPLTALWKTLSDQIEKERSAPVLPKDLHIGLDSPWGTPCSYSQTGGAPDLETVWRFVQAERLPFRSYVDSPLNPGEDDIHLVVRVNGRTLTDIRTASKYTGQRDRLERLHRLLCEKR